MADVEYKILTKQEKLNGLKTRLRTLEGEHYAQKIAFLGIEAPQENNQQLNILASQITATQQALAELEASD